MCHRTLIFLAAATITLGHPGETQARGGGRFPCLDHEVIKVADVPHDSAIKLASQWGLNLKRIRTGYGVDLGYRFDGCSASGRWVGYIGYSETQFDLDDGQLHALARAAGLDDLPPPPAIWKNPDIQMLEVGISVALLFLLFRVGAGFRSLRPRS
jgi:hypothetical protein